MWGLGIIDAAIIVVLILSILTGLVRGFAKELIALCVWIAGIWLGFRYADFAGNYLITYISDELARHAVGFVIILIIVIILGGLLNTALSFILKSTGLSGTDRFLGIIFGFIRGIFIVSLLILAFKITNLLRVEKYTNQSLLYDKFAPIVNWLYGISPDFVKNISNKTTPEEVKKDI